MKILIIFLLFLFFIPFGFYFYKTEARFYLASVSREFYKKVDTGSDVVDLTDLKGADWDEIVFVSPYSSLCDYGIEGYSKNESNCLASDDDGECWLALLNKNELVTLIPIDRRKIDLATIEFPHRLKRSQAKFKILEKNEWPKVEILN